MRVIDPFILAARPFRRCCIAGLVCLPVGAAWLVFLLTRVQQHESQGLATAMFGCGLGMTAICALNWRRERGLWMLYVLGGSFLVVMVLIFVLGIAGDVLREPSRFWPDGADMSVALLPAAISGRLLLTAAVWNWLHFRPQSNDGPAPSPPPPEPCPVPAGLHPRPPSLSAAARPPSLQVARPR